MSRGRKQINLNYNEWEKVFYNNISSYISIINKQLEKTLPLEPISNHIKVIGGYSFKANEYQSKGIPIIRISDFQGEKIDLSNAKFYREDKAFEKFELKSGDIIIAMTGGTIGKLAIVQEGLGKLYLNQRVGKLSVINPNEFITEYIYWIARGIQDKIKNLAYGGAQPNIGNAQIEAMELPFPKKDLQQQIVSFLNDLKDNKLSEKVYFNKDVEDEIIKHHYTGISVASISSELQHQSDLIKKLRQSILQDAVQGKLVEQNAKDEPAEKLLDKIKAEKATLRQAQGTKKVKEKEIPPISPDEIPFEIPKNWVWCRLGQIADVRVGSTPNRNNKLFWNGDIPWVSSGEVNNNFIYSTKEKITKESIKKSFNRIYPIGTVLVAMIGQGKTRGQTSILKINAATNQNVAGLIINNEFISSSYLWLFFLSRYEETRSGASGGNQPAINGRKISATIFALPPLSEQERIVKKVEELMQVCDNLEVEVSTQQEHVKNLMQSVLREAFEGKENKKHSLPNTKLTKDIAQ